MLLAGWVLTPSFGRAGNVYIDILRNGCIHYIPVGERVRVF